MTNFAKLFQFRRLVRAPAVGSPETFSTSVKGQVGQMGDDPRRGRDSDGAHAEREREFSRRTLLRAGAAIPLVASFGAIVAACGGGDAADADHADHAHGDHSEAGHGDTTHSDAAHADTGHADTRHADSGHNDAGHGDSGHADHADHADTPGTSTTSHQDLGPAPTAPHADVPFQDYGHFDNHFDNHSDFGSGHVDIPHSDFIHGDENTGGHTDSPPHGDTPYSDNTRPIGP